MRAAYVVGKESAVREVEDLATPSGPMRSNNIAEYSALILLLERLSGLERDRSVRRGYLVCGDSQLVINQMLGTYRVREAHLVALHREARRLAATLDVLCAWVPRAENPAGKLLERRSRVGT